MFAIFFPYSLFSKTKPTKLMRKILLYAVRTNPETVDYLSLQAEINLNKYEVVFTELVELTAFKVDENTVHDVRVGTQSKVAANKQDAPKSVSRFSRLAAERDKKKTFNNFANAPVNKDVISIPADDHPRGGSPLNNSFVFNRKNKLIERNQITEPIKEEEEEEDYSQDKIQKHFDPTFTGSGDVLGGSNNPLIRPSIYFTPRSNNIPKPQMVASSSKDMLNSFHRNCMFSSRKQENSFKPLEMKPNLSLYERRDTGMFPAKPREVMFDKFGKCKLSVKCPMELTYNTSTMYGYDQLSYFKVISAKYGQNLPKRRQLALMTPKKIASRPKRSAVKIVEGKDEEADSFDNFLLTNLVTDTQEKGGNKEEMLRKIEDSLLDLNEKYALSNNKTGFELLYTMRSNTDLVFLLSSKEEFHAHSACLASQSEFVTRVLSSEKFRDKINKTILVEDWIRKPEMEKLIEFYYFNKVDLPMSDSNSTFDMYYRLFRLSLLFKTKTLQALLIVRFILPNFNKEFALPLLKVIYKTSNKSRIVQGLETVCLNALVKNSSYIIKRFRNELAGLEKALLLGCIQKFVCCLESHKHLEDILSLAKEGNYVENNFDLLNKLGKAYETCRLFDQQFVKVNEFFDTSSEAVEMELLTDETLTEGFKWETPGVESNNIFPEFDHKKPNKNAKITLGDKEKLTIFTSCFSSENRKWRLKIDVNGDDASVFLMEQGKPQEQDVYFKNSKFQLEYTAVLFQIEIDDPAFKEIKPIFFAFTNDLHQIIGIRNFFKLSKLVNPSEFKVSCWVKEYPLYSAVLQHVKNNLKKFIFSEDTQEKNTFEYMNPSDLGYILAADSLHFDDENQLFKFIYNFSIKCNHKHLDTLAYAVRYIFVDFDLLMTAGRDHDKLKHNIGFKNCFKKDQMRRLNKEDESFDKFFYNRQQRNYATAVRRQGFEDTFNKLSLWVFESKQKAAAKQHETIDDEKEKMLKRQVYELEVRLKNAEAERMNLENVCKS